MNDYERLAEQLATIINQLEGMSVPDADTDELVYEATEKLRSAEVQASERS